LLYFVGREGGFRNFGTREVEMEAAERRVGTLNGDGSWECAGGGGWDRGEVGKGSFFKRLRGDLLTCRGHPYTFEFIQVKMLNY
jgi:hypothetical protein